MPKEYKAPQAFEEGDAPAIELKPVTSNQVAAIGHCPVTNTMAVTFTRGGGAVYHYPDVSPETHAAFVAGDLGEGAEPSIGTYFGRHIKPLPFKKYRAPEVPSRFPSAA
jgi:hypothetical protein